MSNPKGRDNAFIPTIQELVACMSFSVLVLAAINIARIIDYHRNNELAISGSVQLFEFSFLDKLNPRLIPTIETFTVWAMIGLAFYLLVWFIFSILGEAKDEAGVVHGFIFPKKSDRGRYELDILRRGGVRLFGIGGAIMWAVLLFTKVLPACAVYFYLVFTHDQSPEVIGKAFISVISLGLYLFAVAPFLRLAVLKPRVFAEW